MLGTFVDLGFGAIILIAVIVGLSVGFSRQFSRPMCGLIAIFGALGLTAVIYTLLFPLGFYASLEQKAIDLFSADFYKAEPQSAETLAEVLNGSYLRILASSADKIWERMVAAETVTLGQYFGKLLVKVAAQFLIWLVLYLAIKYLLFGIKYLMTKISRVVVFKSIDKIFGLVWSLAITYIVVVSVVLTAGEIVLSQFFPNIGDTVAGIIASTRLVKFFHSTNVIGSFIASVCSVSLLTI